MIDFQETYSRENFIPFLRDFLPDWATFVEKDIIKESYWHFITQAKIIAEEPSLWIKVIEVIQKSENDPRISITKEIFKLMPDNRVKKALVIFTNPKAQSYRFSLVTVGYQLSEDGKIVKNVSDAKRYSFLCGVGEKTKTVRDNLIKKWRVNDFSDLLSRFDVEVVRKEFFNNYLDLYIRLYREVIKDNEFKNNLKTQQIDLVSFTKTLLWKIVFLYFIQKKWWLWVEKGGIYGKDWDKDFMRSLWNDFTTNEHKTVWEKTWFFYNDYLEHLFYEWLNKDNRDNDDINDYFNFKVPYLNGWLFKKDYENWNINRAHISNDIFSNTDKTWILDIFDTYNFTVDEDDLYDKEVAVDPEMLGKIFEKMISISSENIDDILEEYNKNESSWKKKKLEIDNVLNKKLGAFYTPREIVHYMTKESLIAYLVNNLKWKKEENEEKVRQLFDFKEQFLVTKWEITESVFDKLASIITEVDELLKKVKVLDPAIGSGAFPMWLLHEISSIRYYIYWVFYETFGMNTADFKNESWKVSMYKIKRDVIQNNIYWVDISSGAIDIARLRFWLSLVVDEETPEPLPNFEFKFVCANTLIPLEEEQEQTQIEFQTQKEINVETLRKYMVNYYNAQSNKDKEDWKTKIEKFLWIWKNTVLDLYKTKSERTKQLETYEPFNANHSAEFFDPSLMMWNSKFDIVIGNPPYVSGLDKTQKEILATLYPEWTKKKRLDLFNFFMVLWNKILNNKWIATYIVPQSWLVNEWNFKLRSLLLDNWLENIILLWWGVFNSAVVDTLIYSQNKKYSNKKLYFSEGDIKNSSFRLNNTKIISPNINELYSINQNFNSILNKCYIGSDKIWNISKMVFGIQTRKDSNSPNYLTEKIVNNNSKAVINWKNMFRYWYKYDNNLYVEYWDWLWNKRTPDIFESNEKILLRQIWRVPLCSFDNNKIYTLNTIYNIVINNNNFATKYVLSILNSKLIWYLWWLIFPESKDIFPRIKKEDFIKLPIKLISPESQKPFIEKVDKILEIAKQSFYDPKNPPKEQLELEKEIDEMVYELYELSPEEIELVENNI